MKLQLGYSLDGPVSTASLLTSLLLFDGVVVFVAMLTGASLTSLVALGAMNVLVGSLLSRGSERPQEESGEVEVKVR